MWVCDDRSASSRRHWWYCSLAVPAPRDRAASDAGDGTLNFYVSDRPNDIDDFESLNVTIDRVGFRAANDSRVEYEVDDRTVDLTELQGANAILIGSFDAPPGEYETAVLSVAAVDGDLKNGSTRVKLPSGKLQVTTPFTIGPDTSVDFVFDITVKKAGNSRKYVLRPVVSESGTDVPIDADGDGEERRSSSSRTAEPSGDGEDDRGNGASADESGDEADDAPAGDDEDESDDGDDTGSSAALTARG